MKGSEFIRMVRKLGRQYGVAVRLVEERGKGSHATLYYGERFTIVKDRKKEIGPGLAAAMMKQLGINR